MPADARSPSVLRLGSALAGVMLGASWAPFLTGVLAVHLRAIGTTTTHIGAALAVFFGTAAVLSVPGGLLVARLSPLAALRLVDAAMTVTLAGLSVVRGLGRSWR